MVLATRWETLQSLPVISTFHASARAIVLVSGAGIFLSWLGALWSTEFGIAVQRGVLAVIIVSAISGVGAFAAVEDAQSRRLSQGVEMAESISASDCEDVWIEGTSGGASLPHEKP